MTTARNPTSILQSTDSCGKTPVALMPGLETKPPMSPALAPQPNERKMCKPGPSISRLRGSDWMNKRTQILSMVAYATPRISPYKMCPTKDPKTALPCSADQSRGIPDTSRKIVNGPKNHQKIPNPSPHPMQEP